MVVKAVCVLAFYFYAYKDKSVLTRLERLGNISGLGQRLSHTSSLNRDPEKKSVCVCSCVLCGSPFIASLMKSRRSCRWSSTQSGKWGVLSVGLRLLPDPKSRRWSSTVALLWITRRSRKTRGALKTGKTLHDLTPDYTQIQPGLNGFWEFRETVAVWMGDCMCGNLGVLVLDVDAMVGAQQGIQTPPPLHVGMFDPGFSSSSRAGQENSTKINRTSGIHSHNTHT